MIAKTWSGILTEIGVESFARRIKRKLTVSLEHIILAIILVHLYIPMYIENIPKSSPLCLLSGLPLQQAGCNI